MSKNEIITVLKECRALIKEYRARWTELIGEKLRPKVIEQLAIPEDKEYMEMLGKLEMKTTKEFGDIDAFNSAELSFGFDDRYIIVIHMYFQCMRFDPKLGLNVNTNDYEEMTIGLMPHTYHRRYDGYSKYNVSKTPLTLEKKDESGMKIPERWEKFALKLFGQLDHQKISTLQREIVDPLEQEFESYLRP